MTILIVVNYIHPNVWKELHRAWIQNGEVAVSTKHVQILNVDVPYVIHS